MAWLSTRNISPTLSFTRKKPLSKLQRFIYKISNAQQVHHIIAQGFSIALSNCLYSIWYSLTSRRAQRMRLKIANHMQYMCAKAEPQFSSAPQWYRTYSRPVYCHDMMIIFVWAAYGLCTLHAWSVLLVSAFHIYHTPTACGMLGDCTAMFKHLQYLMAHVGHVAYAWHTSAIPMRKFVTKIQVRIQHIYHEAQW